MSEQVTAEDFFSDNPPARIIGIEDESDVQIDSLGYTFLRPRLVQRAFGSSSVRPIKYIFQSDDHRSGDLTRAGDAKFWFENGGKLYRDGSTAEYCSPECLGPAEGTAADFAGVIIKQQLGEEAYVKLAAEKDEVIYRGIYRKTGDSLDGLRKAKNPNIGTPMSSTTGYHQNFLIPTDLARREELDGTLSSHLATQLYAWAGNIDHNPEQQYVLSQKIEDIGGAPLEYDNYRKTEKGNKPMAIVHSPRRNTTSSVDTDPQWGHAEIRFADATMSRAGTFLALATTSLVLRLKEHEAMTEPWTKGIQLTNPGGAAHEVATDLSLSKVFLTASGHKISAIDVQEGYALASQKMSERIQLPADEVAAIGLWLKICDDLRACDPANHDYSPVLDVIDWAARYTYLIKNFGPQDLSGNRQAAGTNLLWDRVHPIGISSKYWVAVGGRQNIISDEQIERLIMEPPQQTRAASRAARIKNGEAKTADWSYTVSSTGAKTLFPPYENYYRAA